MSESQIENIITATLSVSLELSAKYAKWFFIQNTQGVDNLQRVG